MGTDNNITNGRPVGANPLLKPDQVRGEQERNGPHAECEADALDILPLSNIPLQSPRLLRSRMLKNIRLESVVEMFANEGSGSGQVDCNKVHTFFPWPEGFKHPDQKLLSSLGKLPSFDVYSTRLAMRNMGFETCNVTSLELSAHRKAQLNVHMRPFTEPLMRQMLGHQETQIQDFEQLAGLLRNPDRPEVLENLILMSERLHVDLPDLPRMLDDYADTFLSVAYYQELLDNLFPRIDKFMEELRLLREMPDLRQKQSFVNESKSLEQSLEKIIVATSALFESFYWQTNRMWEDINEDSFKKVRSLVTANQTIVGGVLCGLTVKLRGWENIFGDQPMDMSARKRAQFIQREMRFGIEKVEALLSPPSDRRH